MPAAAARRLTARPALSFALPIAFALAITWLGLAVASFSVYPVGFFITTFGFAVYVLAVAYDVAAHRHEHSIEVQLPFLQHLSPAVRFVPICMAFQEYELAAEVGELLGEALKDRDALVIASSDFSHVGMNYNQMPPRGKTAPEYAKGQDAKALEKVLALDPKGLQDRVAKDDISMCGYGPVTAMLVAAKKLGAREARLLKYGSSSDVSGDRDMAVGYGAVAVYR